MPTVIRHGAFETNSSSTHSFGAVIPELNPNLWETSAGKYAPEDLGFLVEGKLVVVRGYGCGMAPNMVNTRLAFVAAWTGDTKNWKTKEKWELDSVVRELVEHLSGFSQENILIVGTTSGLFDYNASITDNDEEFEEENSYAENGVNCLNFSTKENILNFVLHGECWNEYGYDG